MIGSNAFVVIFRDEKDGVTAIQRHPNLGDIESKKLGETIDGERISKVHQDAHDGIKVLALMRIFDYLAVEWIQALEYFQDRFQLLFGGALPVTDVSDGGRSVNEEPLR
jgi:hypothetical protein